MPDASTVHLWVVQDREGFSLQYANARRAQAAFWAEELLEIADDGSNDWIERNDENNPGWQANGEHHARSRLRLDTRKWLLSKVLPKVYGDKMALSGRVAVKSVDDMSEDELEAFLGESGS
jgi:hypothetical protein